MAKIAMLGAGSLVFCKTLLSDFLATPALAGSEYRLMALTHTRLDKMHAFAERMIKDNGINATVVSTIDRREALKDADYDGASAARCGASASFSNKRLRR